MERGPWERRMLPDSSPLVIAKCSLFLLHCAFTVKTKYHFKKRLEDVRATNYEVPGEREFGKGKS
jgi:hypothetical protein